MSCKWAPMLTGYALDANSVLACLELVVQESCKSMWHKPIYAVSLKICFSHIFNFTAHIGLCQLDLQHLFAAIAIFKTRNCQVLARPCLWSWSSCQLHALSLWKFTDLLHHQTKWQTIQRTEAHRRASCWQISAPMTPAQGLKVEDAGSASTQSMLISFEPPANFLSSSLPAAEWQTISKTALNAIQKAFGKTWCTATAGKKHYQSAYGHIYNSQAVPDGFEGELTVEAVITACTSRAGTDGYVQRIFINGKHIL